MPRRLPRLLAQELDRPRPGLARGLQVRAVAAALRAQEAVAGAFVDLRLVGLAELLHLGGGRLDGGVHPRVVTAVEPEHWRLALDELRHLRRGAVVDDRGVEPRLRGRVREALAAAPAEP